MADSAHSDRRSARRVERRAASPWFMPLPQADQSLRPLPEVVLLLDKCGRIATISDHNRGERLRTVSFGEGATIHDALHPGCDGDDCDLAASWLRAWESLKSGLPVEWLFHHCQYDALLRFRLQPVNYACGVLFPKALRDYADHSVLFIQDMSAAVTQLVRDERPDAANVYELRRSTDPDPSLVASLDSRLRTVTSRLLVSHEAERKRIGRELHDSLGQSLSLLRLEIESCISRASSEGGNSESRSLERVLDLTRRALGELREITQNLRPTVMNDHGLFGALKVLCDAFRTVCPEVDLTLDLSGCPNSVPDELSIAVYRIAQEGLNNIAQHAHASAALLQCRSTDDGVEMTISDDGVGLTDGGAKRSGLGLITMRERAETLGGKYSVSGNPGKGCTITLNWPKAALESM